MTDELHYPHDPGCERDYCQCDNTVLAENCWECHPGRTYGAFSIRPCQPGWGCSSCGKKAKKGATFLLFADGGELCPACARAKHQVKS